VPESNMPAYSWLEGARLKPEEAAPKMRALRMLGVPYTDADIAGAAGQLEGKTEMDAVVAYLQVLGTSVK
ncbi:MAG: cytochrome-c oxidase, cbb3-type subunit II, partial [Aquabacterium sp.]